MDTGLDKLKALVTTVHITADVVHEVLYNIETRVNWDHGGKDMQVVEKIDDELDVIYFWAKAPPTFTNREFLQSRLTRTLDDGTRVIIYRSVKHDKFPEKPKKFVRAYTKLSGYVIKPNPSGEGCRVTFLSQNDIKASIPSVRTLHFSSLLSLFLSSTPAGAECKWGAMADVHVPTRFHVVGREPAGQLLHEEVAQHPARCLQQSAQGERQGQGVKQP
jgi:hypothetical protein